MHPSLNLPCKHPDCYFELHFVAQAWHQWHQYDIAIVIFSDVKSLKTELFSRHRVWLHEEFNPQLWQKLEIHCHDINPFRCILCSRGSQSAVLKLLIHPDVCLLPVTGPWASAARPCAHHWTVWSVHRELEPAPPDKPRSCFYRTHPPPGYHQDHWQRTQKMFHWAGPQRATLQEPHKPQWLCSRMPLGSRSSSHGGKASWDWGSSQCKPSTSCCWRTDQRPWARQQGPAGKPPHRQSSGRGCKDTERQPWWRVAPRPKSEEPWNYSQLWLSGPRKNERQHWSYPCCQGGHTTHNYPKWTTTIITENCLCSL